MERGDRLANRWVMCGLWMTYSRALGESVSKCCSLRAELAPWSTNQFGEVGRGDENRANFLHFFFLEQTLQVWTLRWKKKPKSKTTYLLPSCLTSRLQEEREMCWSLWIYPFLTTDNSSFKDKFACQIADLNLRPLCSVQKCVNVFPDLYKSYPVAHSEVLSCYNEIFKCGLPEQVSL